MCIKVFLCAWVYHVCVCIDQQVMRHWSDPLRQSLPWRANLTTAVPAVPWTLVWQNVLKHRLCPLEVIYTFLLSLCLYILSQFKHTPGILKMPLLLPMCLPRSSQTRLPWLPLQPPPLPPPPPPAQVCQQQTTPGSIKHPAASLPLLGLMVPGAGNLLVTFAFHLECSRVFSSGKFHRHGCVAIRRFGVWGRETD